MHRYILSIGIAIVNYICMLEKQNKTNVNVTIKNQILQMFEREIYSKTGNQCYKSLVIFHMSTILKNDFIVLIKIKI
jgi:hypothetical protein